MGVHGYFMRAELLHPLLLACGAPQVSFDGNSQKQCTVRYRSGKVRASFIAVRRRSFDADSNLPSLRLTYKKSEPWSIGRCSPSAPFCAALAPPPTWRELLSLTPPCKLHAVQSLYCTGLYRHIRD